jgi:hypothetical protein
LEQHDFCLSVRADPRGLTPWALKGFAAPTQKLEIFQKGAHYNLALRCARATHMSKELVLRNYGIILRNCCLVSNNLSC